MLTKDMDHEVTNTQPDLFDMQQNSHAFATVFKTYFLFFLKELVRLCSFFDPLLTL